MKKILFIIFVLLFVNPIYSLEKIKENHLKIKRVSQQKTSAIGIIGGEDGPTAIYTTSKDHYGVKTDKVNLEKMVSGSEQIKSIKKSDPWGGFSSLSRIITGIIQLILTIFIGIFLLFFSFKILLKITRNIDEEKELKNNNLALGVFLSSSLFGIIILVKRSLYPVFSVLENLIISPNLTFSVLIETTVYAIIYIAISFTIALLIIVFSIKIFDKLTKKIEELKEIQKNNTAIAVFFAGVIISLAYFIEEGLHALLITLIPGPQVNIL